MKDARGKIQQQKLRAYKDLDSFKEGLTEHRRTLRFLYDPARQKAVPTVSVLRKLDKDHKRRVNANFNKMAKQSGYGVIIDEDEDED